MISYDKEKYLLELNEKEDSATLIAKEHMIAYRRVHKESDHLFDYTDLIFEDFKIKKGDPVAVFDYHTVMSGDVYVKFDNAYIDPSIKISTKHLDGEEWKKNLSFQNSEIILKDNIPKKIDEGLNFKKDDTRFNLYVKSDMDVDNSRIFIDEQNGSNKYMTSLQVKDSSFVSDFALKNDVKGGDVFVIVRDSRVYDKGLEIIDPDYVLKAIEDNGIYFLGENHVGQTRNIEIRGVSLSSQQKVLIKGRGDVHISNSDFTSYGINTLGETIINPNYGDVVIDSTKIESLYLKSGEKVIVRNELVGNGINIHGQDDFLSVNLQMENSKIISEYAPLNIDMEDFSENTLVIFNSTLTLESEQDREAKLILKGYNQISNSNVKSSGVPSLLGNSKIEDRDIALAPNTILRDEEIVNNFDTEIYLPEGENKKANYSLSYREYLKQKNNIEQNNDQIR